MRQCLNGHDEITWYNDSAPCPVCSAKEELAAHIVELEEKIEKLSSTKTQRAVEVEREAPSEAPGSPFKEVATPSPMKGKK